MPVPVRVTAGDAVALAERDALAEALADGDVERVTLGEGLTLNEHWNRVEKQAIRLTMI